MPPTAVGQELELEGARRTCNWGSRSSRAPQSAPSGRGIAAIQRSRYATRPAALEKSSRVLSPVLRVAAARRVEMRRELLLTTSKNRRYTHNGGFYCK